MSQDGSDDPRHKEVERLRHEVRALRHEIAGRGAPPVSRGPRGMMMAGAIGVCTVGGAMLVTGFAIDVPQVPGLAMLADLVSTQAAVGIVERLFAVY